MEKIVFEMWGERIFEGFTHIFVLASLIWHFAGDYKVIASFLHLGWISSYLIGAMVEGIRI